MTLRFSLADFMRIPAPIRLTSNPPAAIPIMGTASTTGGCETRPNISKRMPPATTMSSAPFIKAARISSR
ncbi:hypothetical protein D3C86_2062600 [compost metagenome]